MQREIQRQIVQQAGKKDKDRLIQIDRKINTHIDGHKGR